MVALGAGPSGPGRQEGEIELAVVAGAAGGRWTLQLPVAVYQGEVYQSYLPAVE